MTADPSPTRWLVRPRPDPEARLRLVCFPFAGGGASLYRRWPDGLPPSVEVCAVQPPGREERFREPAYRSLPPLVAAFLDAAGPVLERPFVLFGHSLGALVAFEVARALRREGRPGPLHLFVAGRIAPQLTSRRRPAHDLPDAEFRAELRQLQGTPTAVLDHDELMQLLAPLIRADFAVVETYAYRDGPPLDCPITALGGTEDPWVNREELEAWRSQTTAAFDCRQLPGNHFFIQSAEALVLEQVGRVLARTGWSR
jgi:medium-chain acyl-[acyl-carrier-protein] hydrolase